MVLNKEINFPLFSLTWCMGGSYTPIGLCWTLHRPWSACSLAFLTTMRFVWDYYNCTITDCVPFSSVFLPPSLPGSELQSSAWGFPYWLLHCVHDLCGAEPLHLCHSGGIQSRADTSPGTCPCWVYTCCRRSILWIDTPWVIHITHCSCSRLKRMRLWTWCWWNSAVYLDSNIRIKGVTAWLRGQLSHLLQIMDCRQFLLGTFVRVEMLLYCQAEVKH